MMKIRNISLCVAILTAAFSAAAQNLNPSVVVTNTYEGSVTGVDKTELPVNVPDSLLKFNYELDYSVFDNPYNGSYEFHPYLVEMRPDARQYDGKRFYLNAGAGYSFHPELDAVWCPLLPGDFSLGVYDSFKGYVGNYRDYDSPQWSAGRLLDNRLGAGGRWQSGTFDLIFDAGYKMMNSAAEVGHMLNGGDAALRIKSKDCSDDRFFYDVKLSGGGFYDEYGHSSYSGGVSQFDGGLSGSIGLNTGAHRKMAADVGVRFVGASGLFAGNKFHLYAAPQYLLDFDRARVKLGVKLSFVSSNRSAQIVYPDVSADYFLIPDKLDVYARVGGGDHIDSYYGMLKENPFMNIYLCSAVYPEVMGLDNHTDRVNAELGFRGTVLRKLHFDISAGYNVGANVLCESLFVPSDGILSPVFSRCDFNTFHAALDLKWKSERLSVDGKFKYIDTDALRRGCRVLAPAAFKGEVAATYNIGERIFFGLDLAAQTERKARYEISGGGIADRSLPGWFDLGIHGEYKVNRTFSVWLKCRNLLAQPVYEYLLHIEQSPNITAGICVNL